GPDHAPAPVVEQGRRLSAESVIRVTGIVAERPAENVNPDLATGRIEVRVTELDILARAETPPIPVALGTGEELPAEELRLRYRYLDLRRAELQRALELRHRAAYVTRRHLVSEGFWEIETPMLTRRTPE